MSLMIMIMIMREDQILGVLYDDNDDNNDNDNEGGKGPWGPA